MDDRQYDDGHSKIELVFNKYLLIRLIISNSPFIKASC